MDALVLWRNPRSLAQIEKSNPELVKQVQDLSYVLYTSNLLMQCEELGVSVPYDKIDVETVQLVYLLRQKAKPVVKDKPKARGRRG